MMPTTGIMRSLTSELMILLNAPPMMTPTARSMTLPRLMKSRNSLRIGFIFLILFLSFFKSGFFMRLLYLIKFFWYSRDNLVGGWFLCNFIFSQYSFCVS